MLRQTKIQFVPSRPALLTVHSFWKVSIEASPRPDQAYTAFESQRNDLKYQLAILERTIVFLCYLMQSIRAIEGVSFQGANGDPNFRKYFLLQDLASEFFALQFCYECYRYYASLASEEIVPNRFAGWKFDEVIRMCKRAHDNPKVIRVIFRELIT